MLTVKVGETYDILEDGELIASLRPWVFQNSNLRGIYARPVCGGDGALWDTSWVRGSIESLVAWQEQFPDGPIKSEYNGGFCW